MGIKKEPRDRMKRGTNYEDRESFLESSIIYTVVQSDRNSSKMGTFHEPTNFEPHV